MLLIGIICVLIIIVLWVIYYKYIRDTPKTESFSSYRLGGYRLGSYDPNLYISEIERRP